MEALSQKKANSKNESIHQSAVPFKDKDKKGASAGAIILAVFVGLLVLMGSLTAACGLACNGTGAAAILVALLGVFGAFLLIRLIVKGSTRRRNTQ